MSDCPAFLVNPLRRCFGQGENRFENICTKPAAWMRQNVHGELPAFFCDDCHRPGDEPLAPDALYRRVSVKIEVLVAGVGYTPGLAHAEAVALVERALAGTGGMLNLVAVASTIGRQAPQGATQEKPSTKGRG